VAIARALAIEPKVFLLDEPLSNLDAKLRLEVREEIRTLQQRLGLTTIFVTHDQEEALAISDRMAIMHDGKVQQVGRPDALYERPENFFVAEFLGKMNFFAGAYAGPGQFKTVDGLLLKVDGVTENTKQIGVRPERVELSHANVYENNIPVTVQSSAYLGSFLDVILVGPGQRRLSCQVPNTATGSPADTFATGSTFTMNFKASACVVFDEEGGA
jgi:putative spermidine/putrescine transport system ATP-binding protein